MQGIIEFLQGKKTYITALLFGVFNFGAAVGWWTPDSTIWITINTILGMLGFGFLRAGVTKSK